MCKKVNMIIKNRLQIDGGNCLLASGNPLNPLRHFTPSTNSLVHLGVLTKRLMFALKYMLCAQIQNVLNWMSERKNTYFHMNIVTQWNI